MSRSNGEPKTRSPRGPRRPAAFAVPVAIALAALGPCATRATAQPIDANPVHLRWHAPPECPTGAQVAERIAALRSSKNPQSRLTVEATVGRSAGGFRLALVVQSEKGVAHRELSDGDCAALADTAALLVAVASDSLEPAESEAAGPAQDAATEPSPPADAGEPAAREAGGSAEQAAWSLELGLGFQVDYGLIPRGPAPQVGLGVQLRRAPFRFGVDAGFMWPSESRNDAYPDARLRLWAAMGRGRVCLDWGLGPFALGPCAMVEVGSLWSEVRGIDEPHPGRSLWFAGGGTLELRADLAPRLAVSIGAGALVPSDHPRFVIETPAGRVELHQVSAVLGRVTAAVLFGF